LLENHLDGFRMLAIITNTKILETKFSLLIHKKLLIYYLKGDLKLLIDKSFDINIMQETNKRTGHIYKEIMNRF
jgi:hypothetical protein